MLKSGYEELEESQRDVVHVLICSQRAESRSACIANEPLTAYLFELAAKCYQLADLHKSPVWD